MQMQYENIFMRLKDFGFFDVFLPFMLIFSFSFAIAKQIPHIEQKQAGILALVIALISVATHVTDFGGGNIDVVDFINGIIPGITGLVIALIGFFLILALVAPRFVERLSDEDSEKNYPALLIIIPLIIVGYILVNQAGWVGEDSSISAGMIGSWLENPENAAWVTMLIVFVVLIWFITRPQKNDNTKMKNFLTDLFIGREKKE